MSFDQNRVKPAAAHAEDAPRPGAWVKWGTALFDVVGRLMLGAIGWVVFMFFAMFAGFAGGSSVAQVWIGLAWILGAAVVVWALQPIVLVLKKR
jgi:hypothetical protein